MLRTLESLRGDQVNSLVTQPKSFNIPLPPPAIHDDGLLKQIGLFSLLYRSVKRCKSQKCSPMNQKTAGNNSQYFAEYEEREPLNRCVTDFEVKEICFTLHR